MDWSDHYDGVSLPACLVVQGVPTGVQTEAHHQLASRAGDVRGGRARLSDSRSRSVGRTDGSDGSDGSLPVSPQSSGSHRTGTTELSLSSHW